LFQTDESVITEIVYTMDNPKIALIGGFVLVVALSAAIVLLS